MSDNKRVEVRFWNSCNECICFGFQTCINFDNVESAMKFVEAVTIENAKEITVETYIGNECIENLSYDVL